MDYNSKDLLNTITLFNITKEFAGQYTCRVITELNESENAAQMTVIVGKLLGEFPLQSIDGVHHFSIDVRLLRLNLSALQNLEKGWINGTF